MRNATLVVILTLTLASCGTVRDSRLNPVNWFGRSTSEQPQPDPDAAVNPLLPERRATSFLLERDEEQDGTPVAQIDSLVVERRPGGAILRVVGSDPNAALFDVKLVRDAEADDGTLSYTLRALRAPGQSGATRVTAAAFASDQDLDGIGIIRVQGAGNAQVSRR